MVLSISFSFFFSLAFCFASMAAIGVAGAMKTGDLARGLPWPLDGPRAGGVAAPLEAGAGCSNTGGCGWGALNGS